MAVLTLINHVSIKGEHPDRRSLSGIPRVQRASRTPLSSAVSAVSSWMTAEVTQNPEMQVCR